MKTTEHNITGTILRAGTGTEGRVTVEIETTRDQLRDFPFNMIGKSAIAFIADSAPKPETPIPDADGWIEHRPGDAMPCDGGTVISVKHRDGTISHGDTALYWDAGYSGKLDSVWTGSDRERDMQIIAWKPA